MTRTAFALGILSINFCMTAVSAQCRVEDDDFATQNGGCEDLSSGLIWAADSRVASAGTGIAIGGEPFVPCWGLNDVENGGYGGFSDWRPPTISEVQSALANGLSSHLDFFLDGSDDDGSYRWTADFEKIKGRTHRYKIRYTDGETLLTWGSSGPTICVRGGSTSGGGGKGGKGKNNTSAFLQRSMTGGLLLLPLCLVVSSCALRRFSH